MNIFPLLAEGVGPLMKIVAVLFVLSAIILILVVLIQKGKGGGLGAAFSGGVASNIFGSKTGDFLTWVTIAVVAVFLFLAIIMDKNYKPKASDIEASNTMPAPRTPLENAGGAAVDINSISQ